MALINGNDYDHIDFTKNGVTTRHMLKDTLSRQMSGDLVKVQNEEPTSEGTKIWIKPSGDSEVQVPTYEEFEELSDKIDDADATIESLAVGAQPTVSVTDVDGHKRFSFGIPASNGIASITKTATDGVIDTYTIAMTDGTSTSFSVNNSDITPESMAEAIATALQDYARIDGYYPDLTAGNADQLNSTKFVENKEPYLYRPSGGTSDIGNRKYLDAIVGVSLPWNQMVRDEASENQTDFADILTVTDAVEDAAALKVKIEPQQDLHGYDHPWPAGGGKNIGYLSATNIYSEQRNTNTYVNNGVVVTGVGAYARCGFSIPVVTGEIYTVSAKCKRGSVSVQRIGLSDETNWNETYGVLGAVSETLSTFSKTITATSDILCIEVYSGADGAVITIEDFQVEKNSSATSFAPYSNVCPITGWDGVKVTRTGKNLYDISKQMVTNDNTYLGVSLKPNTDYVFSTDKTITGMYVAYSDNETMPSPNQNTGWTSLKTAYGNTFASFNSGSHKWLRLMTYERGGRQERTLQLEFGSTATDYEPYAGNAYDITLPSEAGTVYGGSLSIAEDGSGVLTVDSELEIFDQELENEISSGLNYLNLASGSISTVGNYTRISFAGPSDRVKYNLISNTYTRTMCNMLSHVFSYASESVHWYRNTVLYAFFPTSVIGSTKESVIAYLKNLVTAGTPLTFWIPLATPITYTLTASEVTTLLGTNNIWADIGDVALTYTGTDEHLTLESGKKYLARINGTDSMLLGSAQEITAAKGTDNVFDLTKMFGTSVADYVYNQGAGYFRKWFPKAEYPYNTGELKHVEGLQSHDLVGFNLFDPSDIRTGGAYNPAIGVTVSFGASGASYSGTNPIVIDVTTGWRGCAIISRPLVYGQVYRMTLTTSCPSTGDKRVSQYLIDENNMVVTNPYNYVGNASDSIIRGISVPRGGLRCVVVVLSTSAQKVEVRDACIYLTHNGSRNGEYEPYEKHSHPLDNTVILRGVPKVDSNGVYWDGDRYLPDGTVERRYGVVDLGTLDWEYDSTRIAMVVTGNKTPINTAVTNPQGVPTVACSEYLGIPNIGTQADATDKPDKTIFFYHNADIRSKRLFVKDSSYTDVVAFKAAMSGVMLVYELAEPTIEQALPYRNFQLVDDWGTEEFVTTGMIPVGHESRYPANLRDKLQHLPDAASSNGSYLITQTDGQMTLTPFPAPPTTAGKYVLRATVTNGVATFTWEATT